jgi:tocopherol O-methyltransferase
MITCETVTKRAIQSHYDWATPMYRLLWGQHIHHGLWESDESPRQAQVQLIERLAEAVDIRAGSLVLDVGCGMGGTSIHLARSLGCQVTGLTLSPVQRAWARLAARLAGVGRQTHFLCQDAETLDGYARAFDVVWSVECTEHLFDKPAFFQRVAGWLRPGGHAAICAWLASAEPHSPENARQLYEVCEGFLCPSLGTAEDYQAWMSQAGLKPRAFVDLSEQVTRTWEICCRRVRRSGMRFIAQCAGTSMVRFVDRFETILNAYRTGAMRYGFFVAQAPAETQ